MSQHERLGRIWHVVSWFAYGTLIAAIATLSGFIAAKCAAQERPTSYVILQSAFLASASFDLASTLYYYSRCRPACAEQNRLLAPALKHSPAAAVLVSATLTIGTAWAADQLWQHKNLGRKVWWLIPVVGTINHFLAARANILLMRGP